MIQFKIELIRARINTIRLNTKIGSRKIADKENDILLNDIELALNSIVKELLK